MPLAIFYRNLAQSKLKNILKNSENYEFFDLLKKAEKKHNYTYICTNNTLN